MSLFHESKAIGIGTPAFDSSMLEAGFITIILVGKEEAGGCCEAASKEVVEDVQSSAPKGLLLVKTELLGIREVNILLLKLDIVLTEAAGIFEVEDMATGPE